MPDMDSRLKQRIAALTQPARIVLSYADYRHPSVAATIDLLDQVFSETSDVVIHQLHESHESVVVTLEIDGTVQPVSFWGTPSGFELEGLVYALECATGAATPDLDPEQRALLRQIDQPLRAELYVAPT